MWTEDVGALRPPAQGEHVILRDGSRIVIRPLVTGDEDAIGSWFAGLSAEARYARFLTQLERLDRRTWSELARVDHVDHEAIAALSPEGSTIGIARYIRGGEGTSAEVAVAVADAWRGRGIAGMLLEQVASRARNVGIERFTATCLATNWPVIRLFSRLGPTTVGPSNAGVVDVRIDLGSGPANRCTAPSGRRSTRLRHARRACLKGRHPARIRESQSLSTQLGTELATAGHRSAKDADHGDIVDEPLSLA